MVRRWCRKSSVKTMGWRRLLVVVTAFCTAVLTLLVAQSLLRPVDDPLTSHASLIPVPHESGSSDGVAPDESPPPPSLVDETQDSTDSNVSWPVFVGGDVPVGELRISHPEENTPDVSGPLVNSTSTGDVALANDSSGSRAQSWRLEERMPPWLLPPDRTLMYAKKEIAHAPPVGYDYPDLYSPLFQNISVFKRSYELMERILKVYVYRDGEKPIFHTPPIKGIYASEGWFMKLIEKNKKFVTKDPNKAHLFYLPYSVRQLQLALYVSDKHNMRELSLFLKNYVNKIASKYPFWNRTHGSDHFVVACHDWGPYTAKGHDELLKNTIKALCNADVSEGIFVHGRDVSLPETSIARPRRPLRNLGGKPVSQRTILAFFAGNMHGRVRPILLKYWSGKDEDMRIYGPLPKKVSMKMSYVEHMKSSKFCICPMGYEVNSPRIVEALYYECVPVIIADNFVLPFDDVLDWSAFSVIVNEKDIPNLKDILLEISFKKYVSMQRNVKRLQKHFLWHRKPVKYDIFHMILHSIWLSRLNDVKILQ